MSIWVKVEAGGREAVMEGMERVALGNLVARGALGWGRGLLVMGFWAGRWGREVTLIGREGGRLGCCRLWF